MISDTNFTYTGGSYQIEPKLNLNEIQIFFLICFIFHPNIYRVTHTLCMSGNQAFYMYARFVSYQMLMHHFVTIQKKASDQLRIDLCVCVRVPDTSIMRVKMLKMRRQIIRSSICGFNYIFTLLSADKNLTTNSTPFSIQNSSYSLTVIYL